VRTLGSSSRPAQFAGGDAQNPENSNLLPNKLPETPVNQEIGNLSGGSAATSEPAADSSAAAEALAAEEVAARAAPGEAVANPAGEARISCHEAENSGNQDHNPMRTPTGVIRSPICSTRRRSAAAYFVDRKLAAIFLDR